MANADINSNDDNQQEDQPRDRLADAINFIKGNGADVPLDQRQVPSSPEEYQQGVNKYIKPEDENTYSNVLPQNYLISKLGLPDTWKTSKADEMRNQHNLPMAMATMGTVGSVGEAAPIVANVGETAEQALVGAAKSAYGRLGQTLDRIPSNGSVSVQEPLSLAQIMARRALNKAR